MIVFGTAFVYATCKVCLVQHTIQMETDEMIDLLCGVIPQRLHEELRFLLASGICKECY